MIDITASVEDDFGDSFLLCFPGDGHADLFRRFFVSAKAFEPFFHRRCAGQRYAGYIVDQLGIDVLCGAENIQAGTSRSAADFLADSGVSFQPGSIFIRLFHHL